MNFDLFRAVPGRLAITEDSRMPCARPDRRGFRHDGEVSPLARWLAASLLPLAALALNSAAQAASVTANLAVSASVAGSCTIDGSPSPLAFGPYTGQAKDTTATFTVNCTTGTPVTIALGLGNNEDVGQRLMSNGAGGFLMYNLYKDAGLSDFWGINGEAKSIPSFQSANATQTVHGQIPAGQAAAAGEYSDTVQITASF